MPSNKTVAIICISLVLIAAISIPLIQHKESHGSHNHELTGITAKLSAGVNLNFEMLTKEPKLNERIDIVAHVESLTGPGSYEYKVHIPTGVEFLSPDEGRFDLHEDEIKELEFSFQQDREYDMKIHVEIRKTGSDNASMFTMSTLNFHQNLKEIEALQQRQSKYSK